MMKETSGYWRIMTKNPRKKIPRNASALDLVIQKERKLNVVSFIILSIHLEL